MPDQQTWASFFHPEEMLSRLGLSSNTDVAVEFGCGYGTFTIPAARFISGSVYALDIDPLMISATQAMAVKAGMRNIRTILRDFVTDGTGLASGTVDYAMLFNILHG